MQSEIDKIYDEDNCENIILFNQKGEEIAFEQIAVVPIKNNTYVILKPVIPFEGLDPDEGLVFEIKEINDEEMLVLIDDMDIIDQVFDIYFSLVEEDTDE